MVPGFITYYFTLHSHGEPSVTCGHLDVAGLQLPYWPIVGDGENCS